MWNIIYGDTVNYDTNDKTVWHILSHGNTVCHMVIQYVTWLYSMSHGNTVHVCHMVIQWWGRYLVKVLQNFKWFDDKKITDGYIFADKILNFRFIQLKEFVCCEVVIKILFRLLFRNYLPLEIGEILHLKKTWMIFTQECVVPSLVEIAPVVLEKIFKFVQCILVFFR